MMGMIMMRHYKLVPILIGHGGLEYLIGVVYFQLFFIALIKFPESDGIVFNFKF